MGTQQFQCNTHSNAREMTTNPQKEGHHETDNVPNIDDVHEQADDHHQDDQDLRAHHKQVALKLLEAKQDRRRRNRKVIDVVFYKTWDAMCDGDEFCESFQDTISGHDELHCRRVQKFYKMQDYYEQQRDKYFTTKRRICDDYDLDGSKNAALTAYSERLEDYCANVDSYTVQQDSLEFTALLRAREDVIPCEYEKDVAYAELEVHAKRFLRIVNLLIGWQIEPHHFMPKRADDNCYMDVSLRTTVNFKYIHYR